MLHSNWREKALSRFTSRRPRDSVWPVVQSKGQAKAV